MSLANFLGGGTVLILGLVLRFVRGSEDLIAGYSTISEIERNKWDANSLRLFLGKAFIITSFILLVAGVLVVFDIYPVLSVIVSWVLYIVSTICCVVYMNTSSRFKTQPK